MGGCGYGASTPTEIKSPSVPISAFSKEDAYGLSVCFQKVLTAYNRSRLCVGATEDDLRVLNARILRLWARSVMQDNKSLASSNDLSYTSKDPSQSSSEILALLTAREYEF